MPMTMARVPRQASTPPLAAASETGALGIYQLKRLWSRRLAEMQGQAMRTNQHDRHLDFLVTHAVGLGLEQTAEYFSLHAPSFEEFERWIVATSGGVEPLRAARINAAVAGEPYPDAIKHWLDSVDASEPVLSADDLAFWHEHGYVVLHDAVPRDAREAATQALWDHLGARPDDAETWYGKSGHGIMVQYFQHPAFEQNRRSLRIHKAFAQLWGSADLWASTDRVGFNPPERPGFMFRGPDLHWDISINTPIPFATGGILYLTDTEPAQGAFTLVPGFQRWGEDWLKRLPPGSTPREMNLHALGSKPIGGRAGDLIIWHLALPHGASANRAMRPRMVQYINMFATRVEEQEEWL